MTIPCRHWYQFSIRTVLIAVTLAALGCGYTAHEWRIVQQRKAMLDDRQNKSLLYVTLGDDSKIPAIRRWLGDHAVAAICLGFDRPSEEMLRRYREAFPEWSGEPTPPPLD